jgi:hypothetical protein
VRSDDGRGQAQGQEPPSHDDEAAAAEEAAPPVRRKVAAKLQDSHAKATLHVQRHMKQHPAAVGVAARALKPLGLHGLLFRNPVVLLAALAAALAAAAAALCVCLAPRRAKLKAKQARGLHKKDGGGGRDGAAHGASGHATASGFGGGTVRRSAAASAGDGDGYGLSSGGGGGGLLAGALRSDGLDPKVRAAAASGKYAAVKAWVDAAVAAGASLDVGDGHERTALHLAAKSGHDDVVKLLLARGASPSPRDASRQVTPLHLAAMEGRGPCVKLLLDGGADPLLEDVDRATPLQLAKAAGNVGCTLLLERAEAAALAMDHAAALHSGQNGLNGHGSLDKESV